MGQGTYLSNHKLFIALYFGVSQKSKRFSILKRLEEKKRTLLLLKKTQLLLVLY